MAPPLPLRTCSGLQPVNGQLDHDQQYARLPLLPGRHRGPQPVHPGTAAQPVPAGGLQRGRCVHAAVQQTACCADKSLQLCRPSAGGPSAACAAQPRAPCAAQERVACFPPMPATQVYRGCLFSQADMEPFCGCPPEGGACAGMAGAARLAAPLGPHILPFCIHPSPLHSRRLRAAGYANTSAQELLQECRVRGAACCRLQVGTGANAGAWPPQLMCASAPTRAMQPYQTSEAVHFATGVGRALDAIAGAAAAAAARCRMLPRRLLGPAPVRVPHPVLHAALPIRIGAGALNASIASTAEYLSLPFQSSEAEG